MTGFLAWLGHRIARSRNKRAIVITVILVILALIALKQWLAGAAEANVPIEAVNWVWRMWGLYPVCGGAMGMLVGFLRGGAEVMHED